MNILLNSQMTLIKKIGL